MEPANLYDQVQAEIKAIDKMLKRSQEAIWNHKKNSNEDLIQVMREARVETNKNRLSIDTHLSTVERCIRMNENSTREYLVKINRQNDASNSFAAQIEFHHNNIEQNMKNVKKHMENLKK